jgi:hypothetical protein
MTFSGIRHNKHDFLIDVCIFLLMSIDRSLVILGIAKWRTDTNQLGGFRFFPCFSIRKIINRISSVRLRHLGGGGA